MHIPARCDTSFPYFFTGSLTDCSEWLLPQNVWIPSYITHSLSLFFIIFPIDLSCDKVKLGGLCLWMFGFFVSYSTVESQWKKWDILRNILWVLWVFVPLCILPDTRLRRGLLTFWNFSFCFALLAFPEVPGCGGYMFLVTLAKANGAIKPLCSTSRKHLLAKWSCSLKGGGSLVQMLWDHQVLIRTISKFCLIRNFLSGPWWWPCI